MAGCSSSGAGANPSASAAATALPLPLPLPLPWLALALAAFVLGAALASWAGLRHQRLSEELRDSQAQLRNLGELLDVWQWQTDPHHRVTLLHPPQGATALQWSGTPPGQPLWEVFRCADEAALRAQLGRHASLDGIEVRCLPSADGSKPGLPDGGAAGPVHGHLCGRVRTDARGAFAGYVGTLRERRESALASTAVASGLTSAAPLAAPSSHAAVAADAPVAAGSLVPALQADHESFGYTVSHDLRAPIRVVEGFTRIVKEDYGHLLDRVGNDHLERVLGAAARMNSMIDALLALSKLSSQPLARQPVNLSQLAGYVAEDLRRQSPERSVDLQIEPGLQVLGDPTLLRVVLENLLGNAWKYTGKRDEAQIWFERGAQDGASFSVRDNGAGFDMRFADRLFGVFQRLHSANDFQGTGVGLASVRRIVRRHGGEVWAESELNSGASFHFTLPQDERRA